MKKYILFFLTASICFNAFAQHDFYNNKNYSFTKADTLQGMLRPERTCFDVSFYSLNLKVDLDRRSINGYVKKDNYQMVTPLLIDTKKSQII